MIPSFFRVRTFDVTDSTNTLAKKAAESGEAEGLVIHAHRQTAGRGRLGRVWESPEGNLYVSVLLRPCCSLQDALFYNFSAAMAVHDTVVDLSPTSLFQLKWPNDVLESGRKISGVLLETAPLEKGVLEWLVVGVGINVASHPTDNILYPAISLASLGVKTTIDQVLESFLKNLDRWIKVLKYDGFNPIRKAWLSDARMGRMMVRTSQGTIEGDFSGLDQTGALILRLADGKEQAIHVGDVLMREE